MFDFDQDSERIVRAGGSRGCSLLQLLHEPQPAQLIEARDLDVPFVLDGSHVLLRHDPAVRVVIRDVCRPQTALAPKRRAAMAVVLGCSGQPVRVGRHFAEAGNTFVPRFPL